MGGSWANVNCWKGGSTVYRVAQIDLEFERLERRGLALRNFFRDCIDECTVICFS